MKIPKIESPDLQTSFIKELSHLEMFLIFFISFNSFRTRETQLFEKNVPKFSLRCLASRDIADG